MKKLFVVLISIFVFGAVEAQSKIAYVNSQEVLDTLPSRKAAIKELQDLSTASQKELQDLNDDLQKAYTKYQNEAETLSTVLRQYEEDRIQKMQQNLQSRQDELQNRLRDRGDELNAPILKRLQKAVATVADRKKLEYVLDESQLLYTKGGTDITNEVIAEALKLDAAEFKPATTTAPATTPKK